MERGAAAERAGRTEHGHGDEQEVDEGVLDAGHVVRRRAAARLASAGARAAFIPAGSADGARRRVQGARHCEPTAALI